MIKPLFRLFVELTGNRYASKIIQKFTTSRLSRVLIKPFAQVYKLNLEEMEKNLSEYETLQQLFVRKLQKNVRPILSSPFILVSPVDARIESFGKVTEDATFFIKGQRYDLEEMLGSKEKAQVYKQGTYFILYLSPQHYHRIHSPINGEIVEQWHTGGISYPVNHLGLKYGKRPFSTNYRVITEMSTSYGRIMTVKVGALNINSIHLTHNCLQVEKGEELAYFSFGSTVILLIESDSFKTGDQLKQGMEVKMGSKLGSFEK
ncbi:phosphatidylserine decarboxylase [Bacillus taeanensis]|uniref:Phosphatidylserine decarboxylase proenzyme n=1 Tax=Bacillus taeanensis TaxID=273032 RepID=A0A366XX40_9BACI|nr:phosphatidylserine decarboxylase [Bacillus taeanensis]RBW70467.1 phosphatidylserine decarboxylase [Bacillus taeanensis]